MRELKRHRGCRGLGGAACRTLPRVREVKLSITMMPAPATGRTLPRVRELTPARPALEEDRMPSHPSQGA